MRILNTFDFHKFFHFVPPMSQHKQKIQTVKIQFEAQSHLKLRFIALNILEKSMISNCLLNESHEAFLTINERIDNFAIEVYQENGCESIASYTFIRENLLEGEDILEETQFYFRTAKQKEGQFLIIFDLIYDKTSHPCRGSNSILQMILINELAKKNLEECSKNAIHRYLNQRQTIAYQDLQKAKRDNAKKKQIHFKRYSEREHTLKRKFLQTEETFSSFHHLPICESAEKSSIFSKLKNQSNTAPDVKKENDNGVRLKQKASILKESKKRLRLKKSKPQNILKDLRTFNRSFNSLRRKRQYEKEKENDKSLLEVTLIGDIFQNDPNAMKKGQRNSLCFLNMAESLSAKTVKKYEKITIKKFNIESQNNFPERHMKNF